MKVAIYVHDMRASGVVRAMIALARSLTAQGDEAVLVAGSGAGHFRADDVAPAAFVATTAELGGPLPRLQVVLPLRRVLRELRPDVLLSGGNHGHVGAWAATRGLGIPLVFTFSNPMQRPGQWLRSRWRAVKSRLLIAASARSVVVGSNLARDSAFVAGLARGDVVLIHLGIDLVAARRVSTVAVPPIGAGPMVLAIGRLHPQKNFERLIDALAAANRVRSLRLVVLGDGPPAYRAALQARAAALGIADKVMFAGTTDDVFSYLRTADVFALSSHWEGGPSLALLEAMAVGTPIVAHCRGSDAGEVLADGRFGVLADVDDPEAFAAALLRQTGSDPVRPGDRADNYAAATMFERYRAVLGEVAGRRAKTPQPVSSNSARLPPSVAQAPPIAPRRDSSVTSNSA